MPVAYTCDNCGAAGPPTTGWVNAQIHAYRIDDAAGARSALGTLDEIWLHDAACVDAWCAKAGVTPPAAPVPPV